MIPSFVEDGAHINLGYSVFALTDLIGCPSVHKPRHSDWSANRWLRVGDSYQPLYLRQRVARSPGMGGRSATINHCEGRENKLS